jgi:hypothetical protein
MSDLLARALQQFLAEARSGIVIEDGQVVFDLESAQYSVSSERDDACFICGRKSAISCAR